MTSSSFPVSRCGAPRISVTSVPLAPPSARSACPQGARRIRKTAEPPTAAQSLRAAWAVVAACAGGRTRASAPTGLVAFVTLARADTQVGPHKMRKADGISVGADAFIGPLRQFPRGAASGSEKRSRDNAMTTPTTSAPSATGRQSQKSQKMIACPKAGQNRRLHRSADPRRAEARTRRSASKRSFLLDRARPVSLLARPKGAPAAPRAVGRGGARERAQFSPQAETELSGLCDDDNGGRIPRGSGPLWEQNPPRPPGGGPTGFRGVPAPAISRRISAGRRWTAPRGKPAAPGCRGPQARVQRPPRRLKNIC